jgi:hypothetical protein
MRVKRGREEGELVRGGRMGIVMKNEGRGGR